jgi:sulfate/thiosulfate transport system substrate-binding protein
MRTVALVSVSVLLVLSAAAAAATRDTRLTFVAYSTPREAYAEIIPAFQKTAPGRDVDFSQSYGSSGEQSRAVAAGLKADIVALSLAPDVDALVKAGLVDAKWDRQSYRGIVHRSVVVFVVRDGNPKRINGWNDLLRDDVEVITPNPFTSGGARWNIMAAYGAWRRTGKTDRQAQANLLKLFRNVSVQDKSARESLQTFASGKGDVLLAYENEALFARSKGQDLQFTIPRQTILIENPIAVVKASPNKPVAEAFLRYLRFPGPQRIFARNGYRPVLKSVAAEFKKQFPDRPGLFTIEDKSMGGWDKVQRRFFDPKSGIMARIQRQVGGETG